jgi:RNA polymerase sigma-70 factor (ECF subfamily)
MPTPENDFDVLMERIRAGDPEAGKELFERYGKAIQRVVRYHMDRRLRTQFDSIDFAQDAWASFFRVSAAEFTFQTPEELVAFLTRTVQNKVIDAYRKRSQHSKDNGRTFREFGDNIHKQLSRHPTPSQCAIAEEEWRRMIHNKPPKVQQALAMLRDGYSQREIAKSLGLNVRRIHRLLARLKRLRSP